LTLLVDLAETLDQALRAVFGDRRVEATEYVGCVRVVEAGEKPPSSGGVVARVGVVEHLDGLLAQVDGAFPHGVVLIVRRGCVKLASAFGQRVV
jgi:hypothetical protein